MNDIEKVKQKIDVVDLIGGYIPVKKSGRNFKALCPFHGEKSPSFVISPERQIWHCFGCSKGGDVFTFLMEFEKMEFGEALQLLAQKAGVTLSKSALQTDAEKKRDRIYTLNLLSASFYNFLLVEHPVGNTALRYLMEKRGLPLPLIKKFNLGFAPSKGTTLTSYLSQKKGYKSNDLMDAGLASERNGRVYDFFRNRVMFPIQDVHGNVIAFSGRALDDDTLPKYVNTKETSVYKKGDTLYGLYFAKDNIKSEGKTILVEGEFDVLSAFHEGIKNIVAIKGTALTENQIRVLKRYAPKITFCFDTDRAGTAAQRRSIQLIEKEGISATVIVPPEGKDPDELLRENPILFKKALKQEVSIYDFIINSSLENQNVKSAEGKKAFLDKTLSYFAAIENEVIKEHYLKKIAVILDTSYESVLKQLEKSLKPNPRSSIPPPSRNRSREEVIEEYLLSLLLQAKKPSKYCFLVEKMVSSIEFYTSSYNRLFKYLKDFCIDDRELTVNEFVKTLPPELVDLFDHCYLALIPEFKTEEDYQSEVEKVGREVKLLSVKSKLREITEEIKSKEATATEEESERLGKEFNRLAELLKQ